MAEGFHIAGAIVNQVASDRHAALIREGFERASVPLLGLVRRDASIALPSRHLGLVQAEEHEDLARKIARAGELVGEGCDFDRIVKSRRAPPPCGGESERGGHGRRASSILRLLRSPPLPLPARGRGALAPLGQRIAIARDVAFAFAYPHLLQDWRDQGAELSFFSPLAERSSGRRCRRHLSPWRISGALRRKNRGGRKIPRRAWKPLRQRGALIYGECGGYMVLGESLVDAEGAEHPMLGLLSLATSFRHRKLHLGYRMLSPLDGLPWPCPLPHTNSISRSIVSEGDGRPALRGRRTPPERRLGSIGLRRGRVIGSFAHVIDAA